MSVFVQLGLQLEWLPCYLRLSICHAFMCKGAKSFEVSEFYCPCQSNAAIYWTAALRTSKEEDRGRFSFIPHVLTIATDKRTTKRGPLFKVPKRKFALDIRWETWKWKLVIGKNNMTCHLIWVQHRHERRCRSHHQAAMGIRPHLYRFRSAPFHCSKALLQPSLLLLQVKRQQ